MRKLLLIVYLFIGYVSFSAEQFSHIDSLSNVLNKSTGTDWIECAILLAEKHRKINPEYGFDLLDDAINYSQKYGYPIGIAKANFVKGSYQYDNNKVTTGLTLFNEAYKQFKKLNVPEKEAECLISIGTGLTKLHKPKPSNDTLNYLFRNYLDYLSPDQIGDVYILISTNFKENGNYSAAIINVDSAIIIQTKYGLKNKLSNSYNILGILYLEIGDYKSSLKNYDQFEQLSYDLNDTLSISIAIHNKALIYMEWGAYDESLDMFLTSLSLSQSLGLEKELSSILSNIALVYQEIKDFAKAKYYYEQALELAEKYKLESEMAIILHNMGELLFYNQKYDSSLVLLNRSLRIEIANKNTIGIAESHSMIGNVYMAQKKFPLAFEYYENAAQTFESFGSKMHLCELYLGMGNAHQQLNNDSLATQFIGRAIDIAAAINSTGTLLKAYEDMSGNYSRMRSFEKAFYYYKKYDHLKDSIFSLEAASRRDYLGLKLENQEREKLLERLTTEKQMLDLKNKNRTLFLGFAIVALLVLLFSFAIIYNNNRKSKKKTEAKNKELIASEQKSKALLDASFDSTILVNLNGVVITANTNNLNGFLPDFGNLINSQFTNLFSETNQRILNNYIELVISNKVIKEVQISEVNNKIFNIKISPILGEYLNIASLAFYIQDVTQIEVDKKAHKKMEEQLIQSQKLDTIGTLAGGIAHDLNNFLGTIKGYLEMSLEDITDPENRVHRYLKGSLKAINQSHQTIKKLLSFSRENELKLEKVKLDSLLEDCYEMILGSKPRHISLRFPTLPSHAVIFADANQLTQVILNIITNSFHAIVKDAGLVTVEITTPVLNDTNKELNSGKNFVTIKITDNGFGMDSETMKRIFEPFFTTKEVGKGTGLGLSMSMGIIKQHNGSIEVESEMGIGSIFYINLPLIS